MKPVWESFNFLKFILSIVINWEIANTSSCLSKNRRILTPGIAGTKMFGRDVYKTNSGHPTPALKKKENIKK